MMNEQSIFTAALERDPSERRVFLDGACSANPELRQRLERLLEAHENAVGFMSPPDSQIVHTLPPSATERTGTEIGAYKLREQIGEGGFGVVYVAEQHKPVRRKVALKIIKPGMDTKEVVARFEAERQALALMDHPNVARVIDAGATENGRPYFVMELVHGVPITEFSDKNNLTTRERLELFLNVCQAVQHAHQKGIIHRDLKPSNIMVTLRDGKPIPKVIDFGVSKALSQQLTEKTIYTSYGQVIGTPQYMSPEQAEMSELGVDTRSDVYSLGVLLYELLSGKTPFDKKHLLGGGYAEMMRIIREEEPLHPSKRLSTLGEEATVIAQHRRTDEKKLTRSLRGELDWIVMKALDKDRERRYDTAKGFAADIQRFLNGEAVQACPPSTRYRVRKFVHRHRGPVVAASLFTLLLLAGILGTTTGWLGERQVRNELQLREGELVQARDGALRAQQRERQLRAMADVKTAEARHGLYISQLKVAQRAIEQGNAGIAQSILEKWVPAHGDVDYRGWEWFYLLQESRGNLLWTLTGDQQQRMLDVEWAPDSRHLAAVSEDGAVTIWDAMEGREVRQLVDFSSPATGVCWSSGGDQLVSIHLAGQIQFWNASTWSLNRVLYARSTKQNRTRPTLSPDDSLMAYGGLGGIHVWDVNAQKEHCTLPLDDWSNDVRWSPCGNKLAIACAKHFEIWQVRPPKILHRSDEVDVNASLDWSPDGDRLAVVRHKEILVYDLNAKAIVSELRGHQFAATSVRWSDNGTRIVSGSEDHKIRVWDSRTGNLLHTLQGHGDEVKDVEPSPNGRFIASASDDCTVRIWPTNSDAVQTLMAGEGIANDAPQNTGWRGLGGITWSPDGSRLACGNHEGDIHIWDAESGMRIKRLEQDSGTIHSLVWSDDGRRLASGTHSGIVGIWDMTTGSCVQSFQADERRVWAVAWSPSNHNLLASGGTDGLVKLWDIEAGKQTRALSTNSNQVLDLDWSRDGRVLVAAAAQAVTAWDTTSWERAFQHRNSQWSWSSTAFGPNNQFLAWSVDETIHLIDWHQQQFLRSFVSFSSGVQDLAWTPDGERLVSVGQDNSIVLWEVEGQDNELISLSGHTDLVRGAAWRPDGQALATCSNDNTVRIWDATKGYQWAGRWLLAANQDAQKLQRARTLLNAGNTEAAVESLTRCIQRTPDNWSLYRDRGTAHIRLGNWDAAANDYAQALKWSPRRTRHWLLVQNALLNLHQRNFPAYKQHCAELVDLATQMPTENDTLDAAWVACLHDSPPPPAELLLQEVLTSVDAETNSDWFSQVRRQWVALRHDRPAAVALEGTWTATAAKRFNSLSRAFQIARRGDLDKAGQMLAETTAQTEDNALRTTFWELDVALSILYREVQELVSQR